MKYDSGMTYYHTIIILALRMMCRNDTEITEKFSPNDGSPTPLRDYIKQKYGKSYTSMHSGDVHFTCSPTNFNLIFDNAQNNLGDKNLTLSWSQVAKFIRDNWDEVFKKDKPKSRPLETLVRTFDEEAMTCPNWIKGKTLTYLEKLNGVHFECKAFSAEFCKLDDITRFFVQHCNCPESCLYRKDTAEKQPSYLDKLREKYPKISIEDEWFSDFYCPADLFVGATLDINSDFCNYSKSKIYNNWCEKCWESPCEADIVLVNDLKVFEKDYFEHYPAENTDEADTVSEISEDTDETDKPPENQIATTAETALQGTFDYSELDSDTADKLRAVSERVISIKTTYIIETAKQVKAAHDLLANHYKGLWGAWCKSVGFSRDTGDNLVRVAKVFPEFDVAEQFGNISARLLYAASKPSAPPELVEQVKNGDITTHKKYIELKKQLEEANKRAETAEQSNEKNAAKLAAEAAKTDELLLHIKELESRPIDVLVDHNEVTKRVTEAVNKINSETEQTLAAREQEFAETLHFKDERIWELEDRLKELGSGNTGTDKKIYMVSMTEEDYQKMIVELSRDLCKILSSAVMIDPYGKRGEQ